jgi:hypothetical protein
MGQKGRATFICIIGGILILGGAVVTVFRLPSEQAKITISIADLFKGNLESYNVGLFLVLLGFACFPVSNVYINLGSSEPKSETAGTQGNLSWFQKDGNLRYLLAFFFVTAFDLALILPLSFLPIPAPLNVLMFALAFFLSFFDFFYFLAVLAAALHNGSIAEALSKVLTNIQ